MEQEKAAGQRGGPAPAWKQAAEDQEKEKPVAKVHQQVHGVMGRRLETKNLILQINREPGDRPQVIAGPPVAEMAGIPMRRVLGIIKINVVVGQEGALGETPPPPQRRHQHQRGEQKGGTPGPARARSRHGRFRLWGRLDLGFLSTRTRTWAPVSL